MSTTAVALSAGPVCPTRLGYLQNTWLPAFREETKAADVLLRLYNKRKRRTGPEADALFKGYVSVLRELETTVKHATQIGGLPLLWDGSAALKGVLQ